MENKYLCLAMFSFYLKLIARRVEIEGVKYRCIETQTYSEFKMRVIACSYLECHGCGGDGRVSVYLLENLVRAFIVVVSSPTTRFPPVSFDLFFFSFFATGTNLTTHL